MNRIRDLVPFHRLEAADSTVQKDALEHAYYSLILEADTGGSTRVCAL